MKCSFSRIKKLKGETFAKTLRDAEGGILSLKDLPEIVRYAGTDAKPLIPYLRQKVLESLKTRKAPAKTYAPWKELLADAGYEVHIVKRGKERHSQEEFARYYREKGAAIGEPILHPLHLRQPQRSDAHGRVRRA